jgi:hypothetical protein
MARCSSPHPPFLLRPRGLLRNPRGARHHLADATAAPASFGLRLNGAGRPIALAQSSRQASSALPRRRARVPQMASRAGDPHQASLRSGGSRGSSARADPPRVGLAVVAHGARPARRRTGVGGSSADGRRALALSRAGRRPLGADPSRQRRDAGLPGLPRPALDDSRADQGRPSLRPARLARRVRGAAMG